MAYRLFDGHPVSPAWFALLTEARRSGDWHGTLNSGHRTIAEQWVLYRLWRAGRGNRAAYPSLSAPHIRRGQFHAVDVQNSQELINFAAHHGISLRRTVGGESWHLEGSWSLGAFPIPPPPRPVLHPGDYHKSVQTMKARLIAKGYRKRFPFAWLTPFAKKKYTESTAKAVRAFQREHHLTPDAVVGPATWKALLA